MPERDHNSIEHFIDSLGSHSSCKTTRLGNQCDQFRLGHGLFPPNVPLSGDAAKLASYDRLRKRFLNKRRKSTL